MIALATACGAGTGTPSPDGAALPGADLGGTRAISYTDTDGSADREWIYVAPGPPGAPIVVIAHGQGSEHVVNCWPDDIPHDFTVKQAAELADAIAAEGFTAVAIAYRNAGDGQPTLPTMRLRDLYLRDATAVLAAARDVRDRRGTDGDVPVAFLGHSNGTYAAWWAASDRHELVDLQQGLDIRTIVLLGHTANALASLIEVRSPITKLDRQRAVVLGTQLAVFAAIQLSGAAQIDTVNLDDGSAMANTLSPLLPASGIAAFRTTFTKPVTQAAGSCRSGVPIACDTGCLEDVLDASPDPGALSDYVAQPTIDAIDAWNPDVFTVPTGDNPIVSAAVEISPPFSAGHLLAPRALVEYSANDHVVEPMGQATRDGTLAALRSQGADVPPSPAIASDTHGVCDHPDYTDPTRDCGYREIVAELHAALTRP